MSYLALPAEAQPTDGKTSVSRTLEQSGWASILKNDFRIYAARVTWNRVMRVKADPNIDVEALVEEAGKFARKENKSPEEIKQAEDLARSFAEQDKKGSMNEAVLDFVRIGPSVRCDIKTTFPEEKSPTGAHYTLEFYDGKNAIYMDMGAPAEEAVKNDAVLAAVLTRKESQVLLHSVGRGPMAQVLLGFPLSDTIPSSDVTFTPTNSVIREGPDDTLILERQLGSGTIPSDYLIMDRLIISKKHMRPVAYERLNWEQKVGQRIIIEGYQQYGDGIWFPSKVTKNFHDKQIIEYSLVKADFNESIAPEEVRLPLGVKLSDTRFGADKMATYKLSNPQLPSDDEVRAMLGEQQ